jgi:hypothetical protein
MRQGVSILLNHVTSRRRTQVATATAALHWLAIGYRFFLAVPLAGGKLKSGADALFMPVHEGLDGKPRFVGVFCFGRPRACFSPGGSDPIIGIGIKFIGDSPDDLHRAAHA